MTVQMIEIDKAVLYSYYHKHTKANYNAIKRTPRPVGVKNRKRPSRLKWVNI